MRTYNPAKMYDGASNIFSEPFQTNILNSHQNLISYISAISKPIDFWFSPKLSAIQGLQSQLQPEAPQSNFEIITAPPSNTMWPWPKPTRTPNPSNRLTTVHER